MNVIDLSKKARVVLEKKNLTSVQAEIVLAIDISGSMSGLFNRGVVQDVVDRLLGIGMNMDVNKTIDMFAFDNNGYDVGDVSEGNHNGFVRNVMLKKVRVGGGTNYAPVMKLIVNKYGSQKKGMFSKMFTKNTAVENPTFVFFITDGDNFDKYEAEKVIRDASDKPIFWQFVGIGNERFSFLEKLDNLSDRHVDNANFFSIRNIESISDEELYDKLLTEFPDWLKEVKSKGMIN